MRLHVTPLTPDLLQLVLGPSLAHSVENLTYQHLQTFPENDYAFLDLPDSDAKRLVGKLNGAYLKGRKMKVEEARPSKRSRSKVEKEEQVEAEPAPKKVKKSKKSVEDANLIDGQELEAGRKVKRGWTEPKGEKTKRTKSKDKKSDAKKLQAPSKYTEKEELLFKTNVPANKQDLITTKKRKKGHENDQEPILVHEFEKTQIQPSFLRSTATANPSATYEDGVGWLDEGGNVVEKESPSRKRMRAAKPAGLSIDLPTQKASEKLIAVTTEVAASSTPVKVSSSRSHVSTGGLAKASSTSEVDETNSSDLSETDQDSVNDYDSESSVITQSSSVAESVNEQLASGPTEVHPLEALFKKPKAPEQAKPSLEIETSFTFLDKNDLEEDEEDDVLPPEPLTPFTSQEMRSRGIRSAAPTPDTAHPSRFPSWSSAMGDDDSTKVRRSVTPSRPDEKPQSEFEKRFWAERGANNRAWKARLRNARKEQRQNENRARRGRYNT